MEQAGRGPEQLAGNRIWNFPENFGILTFEEGRDREEQVARPWIDDMKSATGLGVSSKGSSNKGPPKSSTD